jgi:hypothetical protein
MKRLYFIILSSLIFLLHSCSEKIPPVSVSLLNGHELLVLNMKSIRDSTRLNLTDIATNLRFIPLETLPECLISQATYYLTDDYILAKTKTGIYQFDNSGRFIRILVTPGQGPREYTAAEWVIDEKNDRLILADEQHTGYFLYFDLKTGEYLGDIPKAIPGITRKFAITAYGSLACVPYISPGGQTDPLYLYWQDLSGKLLDTVKGPSNLAIYHDNYFEKLPDGYRYMLAHNNRDTIYHLRDKKLIPYLAFNHGEEIPILMEEPGYRTMKIALETGELIVLSKLQVTNVLSSGDHTSISWTGSDYLLDKVNKKALLISGLYNDFIAAAQPVQSCRILPNKRIYCALQALELLGMAERAINSPKSDQKLIGRMEEIRTQISREDNPVLVAGVLK